MSNEISQTAPGQIAIQDVQNSTVSVTQILGKSLEYKEMLNELERQRELLAYLPKDKAERRLVVSQQVTELEARIEQFKKDVLQLAEEFNRIEINTDRLRRAKEHFENGEIAAARAVFDAEREQMQDENDRLVEEKARYETDILPKLRHSADEYYLRALLERTAYDNPRWLEDACEYFERSINAQATEDNMFQYALFLQNHNRLAQAEKYYQQYLDDFAGSDQAKRAMTLNNLANLHRAKNELTAAEAESTEVLSTWRRLAVVNPIAYLPDVAMALNNLANLHIKNNELVAAETEYVEALDIYRKLTTANPSTYLPYVAGSLNNLANLHIKNNELVAAETEYGEALGIRRKLAEANPHAYLPDVAATLNNLANLHNSNNELAVAEAEYAEALAIRRKLSEANPSAHLPYVATTLSNLAVLYRMKNELVAAEAKYAEALAIRRKLAVFNPSAYLASVADTLNNLANLHSDKNELTVAKGEYAEALDIYSKLAAVNPSAFSPYLANTLANCALYYWQAIPNRELSIGYALKAVAILTPIVEAVPYTTSYLQRAMVVLQQGWGLNSKEIEQKVAILINVREQKFQRVLQWLNENKAKYLNQWVAFDDDRLVASGTDGKQVYAEAIAAGVSSPLLHQITEDDDLPFGGW